MKLSSYKRIMTSDFKKEEQPLVEKLAGGINDMFDQLVQALNKRLTLSDNFQATIRDVDLVVNAQGNPTSTTSFGLDISGVPVTGIQVIRAENLTNSAIYPVSQPFISFIQIENTIRVLNVSGLQPNNRYRLRIIAFN
jgi:hypothetical protein